MKKQKLLILWVMMLLTLTACVKSRPKTDNSGAGAEKQKSQNGEKRNTMDAENASEKAAASAAEPAASDFEDIEAWKNAYLEYLSAFEYADSCTYSLIYVDEDEIPELEIDVDELLDMESDDTRAARVKELLVDCYKPTEVSYSPCP